MHDIICTGFHKIYTTTNDMLMIKNRAKNNFSKNKIWKLWKNSFPFAWVEKQRECWNASSGRSGSVRVEGLWRSHNLVLFIFILIKKLFGNTERTFPGGPRWHRRLKHSTSCPQTPAPASWGLLLPPEPGTQVTFPCRSNIRTFTYSTHRSFK